MTAPSQSIQCYQYRCDRLEKVDTRIIVENPVSLTVNGEVWLSFMCTPVDLEALAVGFLYNEALIDAIDEVADIRVCGAGNNVDVWTNHAINRPERWRRTSGCTGGITSVVEGTGSSCVTNGVTLSVGSVCQLIGQLFEYQNLYRTTGGVHTSALTDGRDVHAVAEDIGRHNTLDKLTGRYLMERMDLSSKIIVTTGRISSEMLQKAARLSASIVISRSSPSSLSVSLAERQGITLIGYARHDRFNIYAHPHRIVSPESMSVSVGQ
jgi:FdhD protein